MANPILPGIPEAEQALLYRKLNDYNQGRSSYKEAGTYLVVLPRPDHPRYSLWVYSPLPGRQSIFYIQDLSEDINESLRAASTLCYYSPRRLLLVEYSAKHMQSKGDDLIPVGKYRGHFLHEIFRIDPGYITWAAYKFTPRIPKQERFVHIARIYHSVHIDILRRQARQTPSTSRHLGQPGEKLANLTLKVLRVRLDDDPYKTTVKGNTPYFYVRQLLTLEDPIGNLVTLRLNARTASHESCQLPATEHAFRPGETLHVASARIAHTYTSAGKPYTRLNYVKLRKAE